MDDDFSSPVFDSARERVSEVFRLMVKPLASAVEQDLYACYKCDSKDILRRGYFRFQHLQIVREPVERRVIFEHGSSLKL